MSLWTWSIVMSVFLPLENPPPLGAREVIARTINNWNVGVCTGNPRSWSGMTSQWYGEITNTSASPVGHGGKAWVADGQFIDGQIVDSDFTDPSLVNWGRDNWVGRWDEADVAMIGLHGNNANDGRWLGSMRINENGPGSCATWQGEIELGDQDAEFIHISSCVSMDDTDWHPNWSSSFRGVHQINGFHGVMYIFGQAQGYPQRYKSFADDAFELPIALAWLDNMYDRRDGVLNDQCPVSRGVGVGGDGQADCWDRMYDEQYDNVRSDPTNPTWHGVIYVTPCSPAAAGPLLD